MNDALDALAQINNRASHIITLRYFGGFSIPEVAEHLGIGESTVEKDWRYARAWLRRRLG